MRALRATASPLTGVGQDLALLKATWEQHQARFGLERVELATSSRARVPMVLGWRRPLIVLPSSLLHDLPQEELCTVLAHECAHVQRHDFAWNLLYEVATFLVAYHPLLWATRARVAESREWVCDETACHDAAGSAPYARSLLRLASILLQDEPAAYPHAIGMFGANSLERRLMYLTRKQSRPMGARRMAIAIACVSIALGTCGSAWAWRTEVVGPSVDVGSQTAEGTGKTVKVSGGVMAGQVLTRVNPVYPRDAREAKIQGSVKLSAVIGKDGAIQSLTVNSGPAELQRAAIDAVRQWTYKPFLLNGNPVAVDTMITVNFQLQP